MKTSNYTDALSTHSHSTRQRAHMVQVNTTNLCIPCISASFKPTLSPPRFLLHQCTLMKGNAPTMNPVMLHAKITTCFYCDKGKKQPKKEKKPRKLRYEEQFFFSFFLSSLAGLQSALKQNKKKIRSKDWTVLCRHKPREKCHPVQLVRAGFLVWGFSSWRAVLLWTLGRQIQQDTQPERSAPPVTAPIHTVDIWGLLFFYFLFFT